jgi:hypothetical protein
MVYKKKRIILVRLQAAYPYSEMLGGEDTGKDGRRNTVVGLTKLPQAQCVVGTKSLSCWPTET